MSMITGTVQSARSVVQKSCLKNSELSSGRTESTAASLFASKSQFSPSMLGTMLEQPTTRTLRQSLTSPQGSRLGLRTKSNAYLLYDGSPHHGKSLNAILVPRETQEPTTPLPVKRSDLLAAPRPEMRRSVEVNYKKMLEECRVTCKVGYRSTLASVASIRMSLRRNAVSFQNRRRDSSGSDSDVVGGMSPGRISVDVSNDINPMLQDESGEHMSDKMSMTSLPCERLQVQIEERPRALSMIQVGNLARIVHRMQNVGRGSVTERACRQRTKTIKSKGTTRSMKERVTVICSEIEKLCKKMAK